jgi:hypothetical protein
MVRRPGNDRKLDSPPRRKPPVHDMPISLNGNYCLLEDRPQPSGDGTPDALKQSLVVVAVALAIAGLWVTGAGAELLAELLAALRDRSIH